MYGSGRGFVNELCTSVNSNVLTEVNAGGREAAARQSGIDKGGSDVNPNALKYNGDGTWTSNEGLIYGQSQDGNRVIHVLKHTTPDPSKPLHTVYNVDKSNVIGLVDEA